MIEKGFPGAEYRSNPMIRGYARVSTGGQIVELPPWDAATQYQLAAVIAWSVRSSNLRDRLGELPRGSSSPMAGSSS
jgi:hypothetical protein